MIMKTRNIVLTGIATLLVLSLTWTWFAMNGNGMWKWQGQWIGQGQGKSGGNAQISQDHTPGDLLEWVPLQDLSEQEQLDLMYSYSEETLAHDMYMYFYELYGQQTFLNIANSESEHQAAVKSLLDRYGIDIPTDYGELNDEFEALKTQWEQGLKEALEVGVKIEMLDIEDIADTILSTDNDDIKIVFTNIGGASYNHLRGFVKALNNNGFETNLDYEVYVTDLEIASGEVVKDKMAEKVIAAGAILPASVSPESIAERCANEQSGGKEQNSQSNGNGSQNKGGQSYYNANLSKYMNSNVVAIKNKYKTAIEEKYTQRINMLSESSRDMLVERIDALIETLNTQENISIENSETYTALLLALREVTVDSLIH